ADRNNAEGDCAYVRSRSLPRGSADRNTARVDRGCSVSVVASSRERGPKRSDSPAFRAATAVASSRERGSKPRHLCGERRERGGRFLAGARIETRPTATLWQS